MNERIKELAERCRTHYYDGNGGYIEQFDEEKFAELIVRECVAKVKMRKKFAMEDEHIMEHEFDLLIYDLESHFGVEE